ncbi:MAG: hydroxyproline-2-epimerase [Oceanicaulis sp.]|nr:hydroxyproline-2-epimerase [Maricaulis sp.]MBI74832.1 hydroxyproline-2-epimerase [Oceanicaulis sp.]
MRVIDSHTGGQPTRVIVEGGPDLGTGPLSDRLERFRTRFDHYRTMAVLEPRCSDAMVGALLCEPDAPDCSAGVIFFNTSGYLGMCGHGTIGLAATLAWMGRMAPGLHRIDTPVGVIALQLVDANTVQFENVESRCMAEDVELDVPDLGRVRGDIAWGGNWFFLTEDAPLPLVPANIPALTRAARAVRQALVEKGLTGLGGVEIDHIEFFSKADAAPGADSRNFVLCPGGAYDRSPCGTGTSAKLACLARRDRLAPGEIWVQESIIGSRFSGHYRPAPAGGIVPVITGTAHVFADTRLIDDATDPFRLGIL